MAGLLPLARGAPVAKPTAPAPPVVASSPGALPRECADDDRNECPSAAVYPSLHRHPRAAPVLLPTALATLPPPASLLVVVAARSCSPPKTGRRRTAV